MEFEEFKAQYELQHPASIPQINILQSQYPPWLTRLALLMFLAASAVSGVHTISTMRSTMIASLAIPEAAKDLIAYSAYFGFEIALFVSVFSWIRRDHRWLSFTATAVVFIVILLANIQDISQSAASNAMSGIIVLGIGLGTPLVALLSGKLFVDIYAEKRNLAARAEVQYREDLKTWDSIINREYSKATKPRQTDGERLQRLSTQTDDRQTGYGYSRQSSAVDKALAYLSDNPDALRLPVRDLGEAAGVGKDSAAKAKAQFNGNGHKSG